MCVLKHHTGDGEGAFDQLLQKFIQRRGCLIPVAAGGLAAPLLGYKVSGLAAFDTAAAGVFPLGQRLYAAVGPYSVACVKGAIGAFCTAAAKMLIAHKPVRLRLNTAKHRGYGQPLFRRIQTAAAKVGYGLNVHAAHMGRIIQSKADNIPQCPVIDTGSHCRHQHYRQSGSLAVFYSTQLCIFESCTAKGHVYIIIQTVKLQKHCADPGLCQMLSISRLICKAQTVGIELKETKTLFASQSNYLVQIVPHGRLAAGELNVEGAAVLHQHIVLLCYFFKAQVSIGIIHTGGGEAHRAFKIAALCKLQQHTAAVSLMILAQAAVVGAALFNRLCPHGHHLAVGIVFSPCLIAFKVAFPDKGFEAAVLPAALFHVDIAVISKHPACGYLCKADGAGLFKGDRGGLTPPLS